MSRWEYKSVKFETKGWLGGILELKEFDNTLNEQGRSGWELVNAFDTNQTEGSTREVIAVFKRPTGLT